MSSDTTAGGDTSLDAVADICLAHLSLETERLERSKEALTGVREALRGGGEKLLEAVETQRHSEQHLAELQSERAQLVTRLAEALGLPPQRATTGQLQWRLPAGEKRDQLQAARRRARVAAQGVERLCRGNAALIAHRMDLTRRLLQALGDAATPTYECDGRASPLLNSTIERDC